MSTLSRQVQRRGGIRRSQCTAQIRIDGPCCTAQLQCIASPRFTATDIRGIAHAVPAASPDSTSVPPARAALRQGARGAAAIMVHDHHTEFSVEKEYDHAEQEERRLQEGRRE